MNRRDFASLTLAAPLFQLLASPLRAQSSSVNRPKIGMLVYNDMILLDLVGPLTAFNMMQADVHLIARSLQPINPDVRIPIAPTDTFETSPTSLDVLFVPGGLKGTLDAIKDDKTIGFVKEHGATAGLVTSVCTGSLLLGAAGLLSGYRATSHWYVRDLLAQMGATVQTDRVVVDRNRITGGGVTAGIDFGLTIAAKMAGEETAKRMQLLIEYDPKPPFDAGSPEHAGTTLVEDVLARRKQLIDTIPKDQLKALQRG